MALNLEQQVYDLRTLVAHLRQTSTITEKLAILNALPIVRDFFHQSNLLQSYLPGLNEECDYVIKSIIAIGQGPIVFNQSALEEVPSERLHKLAHHLVSIEHFYQYMGGIIGYHLTVLSMIFFQSTLKKPSLDNTSYIQPEGLFLGHDEPAVRQAIRWGLESLGKLVEIYPVGGAGDRLNLMDEETKVPLPAAVLPFLGKSLLEGLIRDLQAREYLHFKLYNKQLCIPVAMMTSTEKNNHVHILDICQRYNWFGRPSESFYFFVQPLVPVITQEGNWSLSSPLTLTLKPGGHGVMWKLAEEQGVFAWLTSQGIEEGLVRQINNPLAGIDSSILGLVGIGCKQRKAFGFVSCERLLNSAEGTNVLIETQISNYFEYRLTNIEYTDFSYRGIGEEPAKEGSPYSIYPTNTNILFVHIPAIQEALHSCPIPGQLINMKSKVSYIDQEGHVSFVPGGRLESTMQNIADYIVDRFPNQLHRKDFKRELKSFIVYNKRSKTISTTKKSYIPGESPVSTPEQAYYDILSNNRELLKQGCHFRVPTEQSLEEFLKVGPNCLFLFHPALGPLYSVIQQKIRHGRIAEGAELQIELAEVNINYLDLEGSLLIESPSPLGTVNENDLLTYGHESRCHLQHVTIRNKGIDYQLKQHFWKNQLQRHECVRIHLKEGAEFHAEHVTLTGNCYFEVPAYHRLTLKASSDGSWTEELTKIDHPSWSWHYHFDKEDRIKLQVKHSH